MAEVKPGEQVQYPETAPWNHFITNMNQSKKQTTSKSITPVYPSYIASLNHQKSCLCEEKLCHVLWPYLGGGWTGGGTLDFAKPTHATSPTASITHPKMSYFRSLLFFVP